MTAELFPGAQPDQPPPPSKASTTEPPADVQPSRDRCAACFAEIPAGTVLCLDCEDYAAGDGMAYPFAPEQF